MILGYRLPIIFFNVNQPILRSCSFEKILDEGTLLRCGPGKTVD